MTALRQDPAPIEACTIARDIQTFDLLIEDMENELGERWGDLAFEDGLAFLTDPDSDRLRFVAIAVDAQDEADFDLVSKIIQAAKQRETKVILIADDLSPMALHQLLRMGADDFVPYPLPEGALHEAVERQTVRAAQIAAAAAAAAPARAAAAPVAAGEARNGAILPVHGLAGGIGASTFAVNLAWELANLDKTGATRVCLLDLDLQYGSISTFLDLPRREAVYELLSNTGTMDTEALKQATLSFNEKLSVLTSPAESLPLDILTQEDVAAVLDKARESYDFVIVDMPSTLVQWTETVLHKADVYFCLLELDMRSAQNALRFIRTLKAEDLPFEKIRYVLNRAPGFTDLSGKSRVKRMAESLDIDLDVQLPDGGKQVLHACDHGLPLAETAKKNPLRKEILKLAKSIYDLSKAQAATA
jgi:pilus assembly protein CpaE